MTVAWKTASLVMKSMSSGNTMSRTHCAGLIGRSVDSRSTLGYRRSGISRLVDNRGNRSGIGRMINSRRSRSGIGSTRRLVYSR